MAEPDSGKTLDPVPEAKPYLGGVFNIGKVLHDVTLSETHFSWTKRGDTNAKKGIWSSLFLRVSRRGNRGPDPL